MKLISKIGDTPPPERKSPRTLKAPFCQNHTPQNSSRQSTQTFYVDAAACFQNGTVGPLSTYPIAIAGQTICFPFRWLGQGAFAFASYKFQYNLADKASF